MYEVFVMHINNFAKDDIMHVYTFLEKIVELYTHIS